MAEALSRLGSARRASTRQSHCLHRSTLLALLPVVTLLVLLLIPGAPSGYLASGGYAIHFSRPIPWVNYGTWHHGWPWEYLKRTENYPDLAALRDPAWLNASAWWGGDEVREWNLGALLGDACVAIGILLVVAACVEWHRRRHSRFLQFSLAELAYATMALAASLAWWVSQANERHDEAHAIKAMQASSQDFRGNYLGPYWLRQLFGKGFTQRWERVQYAELGRCDFEHPSNRIAAFKHLKCLSIDNCSGVRALTQWLKSLTAFEDLYFASAAARDEELDVLFRTTKVRILRIRSESVTDAGFKNVTLSNILEHVDVRNAHISDQTLIQLGKVPTLLGITLENVESGTQNIVISDLGIASLCNASHLFRAGFSGTGITDEGIRSLAKCKELLQLYLRDTRISGMGFLSWDGDSPLDMLDLSASAVTDDGLAAISRLKNLSDLSVRRTRVSSAGLAALSELRALKSLDLSETNITDSAIDGLKSLKHLRRLDLSGCRLSKVAVDQLRAVLKNCDVQYDP